MKRHFRELQIHQMDDLLMAWRSAPLSARPGSGWARSIRESLGMSATALARRLGMSVAGVRKLETAEESGAITLASLRKLAQGLDCELKYALVTRTSLKQQVRNQAERIAHERLQSISHSMAMEDQPVSDSANQLQIEATITELLAGSRRQLW